MKLTITNPEVVDTLEDFSGGLWPIHRSYDSRMILVIKTSRVVAQTARLRRGFRFYLIPVRIDGVDTYGLTVAFFDDSDEPLTICTPLFNEEFTRDFLSLLSSESFYVHFFDEHSRELLGFRAENPGYFRFHILAGAMSFVSPTLQSARQVHDDMKSWFGARSSSDDDAAFSIHLREQLFPDNLTEHIDNPGDLNESDIAMALHRTFRGDQVYLNPFRADDGREFVDILVATADTVVLIQAKDSPSTASTLSRKINRKKEVTAKHVNKASRQLNGSINYLLSGDPIEIITDRMNRRISASGCDIFGLVIVKELFDAERPNCSAPVLTVFDETGIPCLLLDHNEFQQLTFYRTDEESLVGTLKEIFSVAYTHRAFPRSRFGLRIGKSVVYKTSGTGNALVPNTPEPVRPVTESKHVTVAQPSVEREAGKVLEKGLRGDLGADWLRVVVDRSEVEAQDVSCTAVNLSRVLIDRNAVERYRGGVDLVFYGYSNDPRELYEIPEIRNFCTTLDDAFPYWFYFLSTERESLMVIACCLCSVTQLRPGVVSIGSDLLEFMTRHYNALNWLFDNYSLDEKHNVEISGNVAKYFNKFEAID